MANINLDGASPEDFLRFVADTGGVFQYFTVIQSDFPMLAASANAGDGRARRILECVGDAVTNLSWRDGSRLCGGCKHEFREDPDAFIVVLPLPGDPGAGLVLALCSPCRTLGSEGALAAVRRFWPGLQVLDPMHAEGGRA